MPIQDPELIKNQLDNAEKVGNWFDRNPRTFSVVFMLLCCGILYYIMRGVNNDIKAERDLYKNIILNRLEKGEGQLDKVETKVDTLLPKVQESNDALNSIIQKHNRK